MRRTLNYNDPVRQSDGSLKDLEEMGGGDPYVLPPATDSELGGIIIGSGLSVDEDGVASVTVPLPAHTAADAGKVLKIAADGSLTWGEVSGGSSWQLAEGLTIPDGANEVLLITFDNDTSKRNNVGHLFALYPVAELVSEESAPSRFNYSFVSENLSVFTGTTSYKFYFEVSNRVITPNITVNNVRPSLTNHLYYR